MAISLKGRDFITLKDFSKLEIEYLLNLSADLKQKKRMGIKGDSLEGKNIALIFEKPSTRTRSSFVVGCVDEGGHPEYLGKDEIHLGHKELTKDTARVLSRIYDGIEFRGFEHATVEELADYSCVPVWNGLTDDYHPTQILADFLTMKEQFGKLKGLNFVYIGDGRNNMANSLMIGCSKIGVNFILISPSELWADESLVEECKGYAMESGSSIKLSDNINDVENADVIYTDVWYSMGEEKMAEERIKLLAPYQVNSELMAKTKNENTIFMHCLPVIREKEVTEEVFEKFADVIFDEAENRLHTIKAVMVATIGKQ